MVRGVELLDILRRFIVIDGRRIVHHPAVENVLQKEPISAHNAILGVLASQFLNPNDTKREPFRLLGDHLLWICIVYLLDKCG